MSKTLGGLLDQANNQANSGNAGYGGYGTPTFGGGSGGYGGYGAAPTFGSPEDSIPDELQDEPIFEMDYKSEQERCIDKARRSIMIVVRQVVPETLQKTELILDKIEQDAEQLGNLYFQYQKKETYHQGLMNIIARGDHSTKAFDVCEKISRSLEDLGQNITNTQNQLRKYYIDTYLDMQNKDSEDEIIATKIQQREDLGYDQPKLIDAVQPKKAIVDMNNPIDDRYVGTDAVTKDIHNFRKEKLKTEALKAKEENNNE